MPVVESFLGLAFFTDDLWEVEVGVSKLFDAEEIESLRVCCGSVDEGVLRCIPSGGRLCAISSWGSRAAEEVVLVVEG